MRDKPFFILVMGEEPSIICAESRWLARARGEDTELVVVGRFHWDGVLSTSIGARLWLSPGDAPMRLRVVSSRNVIIETPANQEYTDRSQYEGCNRRVNELQLPLALGHCIIVRC